MSQDPWDPEPGIRPMAGVWKSSTGKAQGASLHGPDAKNKGNTRSIASPLLQKSKGISKGLRGGFSASKLPCGIACATLVQSVAESLKQSHLRRVAVAFRGIASLHSFGLADAAGPRHCMTLNHGLVVYASGYKSRAHPRGCSLK